MKIRTILWCLLSSLGSTVVLFATGLGAILLPSSSYGAAGDLYVAENQQSSVVRITPAGTQSVVASGLDHPLALAVDANGNIFVTLNFVSEIKKITNGIASTFASVTNSRGLTFGGSGNLFVTQTAAAANGVVIEITPNGTQSIYASGFHDPGFLVFDQSGNLFVCENQGATTIISKTTPAGVRTTFASGLVNGEGLAFDASGNLYLAETGTAKIYKFTPDGTKTLFTSAVAVPRYLAFDSAGSLFVSTGGSTNVISKVTPSGAVSVFKSGIAANGIAFEPPLSQPLNISTRLNVQTGDNALFGGFIVAGNAGKKVLIRGIGPSLASAGISGALQDPTIELRNASGGFVNGNNNWKDTQQAAIAATGAAPTDDRESALLITLGPGAWTVIMRGTNNTTGIGVVEVYDLDPAADAKLANISTRGYLGTGSNGMIAGIIIGSGNGAAKLLVRALGPSLTAFGITNALKDPEVNIYNANGGLIVGNDNWKLRAASNTSQQAEIEATGIPPSNGLESALIVTLPAGNFTAIAGGLGPDPTGQPAGSTIYPMFGSVVARKRGRPRVDYR
jgi:sugar lactone lactonase YvrE